MWSVNIAFSGAVLILVTSLCHHTQNDWTLIQQVMAHWMVSATSYSSLDGGCSKLWRTGWWLPHHSTLDLFANSVWSQPWLHTPPQHYKCSQWGAESGRQNECSSCHYFGLYGDTPWDTHTHWSMRVIVGSALCLWIKFRCTMMYLNQIIMHPYLGE